MNRRSVRLRVALLTAVACLLATASAPRAQDRSFIWRATGPRTSIYLLGSVHLLSKDYYPLSQSLEAAFKDSDLLVEELDLDEMLDSTTQMRLLTRGMLPPGQSLEKVVSPTTYGLVAEKAAALGLPLGPLNQFKPWSLSLMLMSLVWTNAGFDANLGLDRHFYNLAKKEGRLIQGLETSEFQISRFDEMTMPVQERLLAQTLKDLESGPASVTTLANAWRSGDVQAVERTALDDMKDEPEMYKVLLVDRNRNWLPKIEALFNRRGRAMVVVGAAHLVGPDGLLKLLRAKGYQIEQL